MAVFMVGNERYSYKIIKYSTGNYGIKQITASKKDSKNRPVNEWGGFDGAKDYHEHFLAQYTDNGGGGDFDGFGMGPDYWWSNALKTGRGSQLVEFATIEAVKNFIETPKVEEVEDLTLPEKGPNIIV